MRRGTLSRVMVCAALACVGFAATSLGVPTAGAEVGVCYTDPVVVLSNGTTIDLNDTINDTYTDVQSIVYTLHAPAGTSVASVTYTSGPIGPMESLRFYADQTGSQYSATSDVITGSAGIAVTAAATALNSTGTDSTSADGWNGQKIRLSVTL